MTALGNDYHFDEVFARQVWGLGEKGDVLIAFTTSGKSRNVLRALEEAKRKGLESICFLGRDGGFTKGVATLDLIVPGDYTARIKSNFLSVQWDSDALRAYPRHFEKAQCNS